MKKKPTVSFKHVPICHAGQKQRWKFSNMVRAHK